MTSTIDRSRAVESRDELAEAIRVATQAQRDLNAALETVDDVLRALQQASRRLQGALDDGAAALEVPTPPPAPSRAVRHPRAGHSSDPLENPPEDARQLLAWLRRLSDQTGRDLMPIAQHVAHRAGAGSRVLSWPHEVIQDAAREVRRCVASAR